MLNTATRTARLSEECVLSAMFSSIPADSRMYTNQISCNVKQNVSSYIGHTESSICGRIETHLF